MIILEKNVLKFQTHATMPMIYCNLGFLCRLIEVESLPVPYLDYHGRAEPVNSN
jgi:hypothetical protein